MASFFIRHRKHNGELLHTIRPENLNFTQNLNGIHDVSYQISMDNPIISEENTDEGDPIGAYQHDWELVRDGEILPGMAGMITSIHIPEGQEVLEVHGQSWMHYLDRRHFPYNGNYPQQTLFRAFETDVTEIIRSMIDTTCARPYSVDIDTSDLDSRTTFDQNYRIEWADNESIYSKINTLAEGKEGFDFAITHDKKFKLWYPEYSDPTNVQCYIEAAVTDTDTRFSALMHQGLDWTDNGPKGTHIAAVGAGLTTRFMKTRGSIDGQQTFRRLDFDDDFGDVVNANKLEKLADGALRAGVRPQREVPFKVVVENIPDFYTKMHVGNYFQVRVDVGAHFVGGVKKVIAVEVEVTNEGEEIATIHSTLWRAWYDVESAEDQY